MKMVNKVSKNVIYNYLLLTIPNRTWNGAVGATALEHNFIYSIVVHSAVCAESKVVILALYVLITYHFKNISRAPEYSVMVRQLKFQPSWTKGPQLFFVGPAGKIKIFTIQTNEKKRVGSKTILSEDEKVKTDIFLSERKFESNTGLRVLWKYLHVLNHLIRFLF